MADRWNCRRHSGLGGFSLIEFDAIAAVVLGAVERGVGFDRLFAETIVKYDTSYLNKKRSATRLLENKRGAEAPLKLQRRNPLDQRLLDRRLVN